MRSGDGVDLVWKCSIRVCENSVFVDVLVCFLNIGAVTDGTE